MVAKLKVRPPVEPQYGRWDGGDGGVGDDAREKYGDEGGRRPMAMETV